MSAFDINALELPLYRVSHAVANKYNDNLIFIVGGGIGDRACAEPTVRYALDTFKNVEISLFCETPELFEHLIDRKGPCLKAIYYNLKDVPEKGVLPLYTYPFGLGNQFMNPNLMHGVDFASVSAIRANLPPDYRQLKFHVPRDRVMSEMKEDKEVVIHLGKSWKTRTFPSEWWQRVIKEVIAMKRLPVLVGENCVEVDPRGCLDLRGKLTFSQFMSVCQHARTIITNDSSPVHLAAPGRSNVAFVPTCRRPDLLLHAREIMFGNTKPGWMTPLFGRQMWEDFNVCPNEAGKVAVDELPPGRRIEEYLPDPKHVALWTSL